MVVNIVMEYQVIIHNVQIMNHLKPTTTALFVVKEFMIEMNILKIINYINEPYQALIRLIYIWNILTF